MEERKEIRKKDILNRLKRIEGQVKGIQGMVDKEVGCKEVLIQISAIRSAINKVGALMLENYACNCLSVDDGSDEAERLKEIIKIMNTFVK